MGRRSFLKKWIELCAHCTLTLRNTRMSCVPRKVKIIFIFYTIPSLYYPMAHREVLHQSTRYECGCNFQKKNNWIFGNLFNLSTHPWQPLVVSHSWASSRRSHSLGLSLLPSLWSILLTSTDDHKITTKLFLISNLICKCATDFRFLGTEYSTTTTTIHLNWHLGPLSVSN